MKFQDLLQFIPIPAGTFMMGSEDGFEDEKPVHEVTLKGFEAMRCTVTQAQWEVLMGNNPSHFNEGADADSRPVEKVSWDDCQEFVKKLNAMEDGYEYSLPTEEQQEYMIRAGSTTKYPFGNTAENIGAYAWYSDNSGGRTHPVGLKLPNAFGLHDTLGNVWEWSLSEYESYADKLKRREEGPRTATMPDGSTFVLSEETFAAMQKGV